MESECFKVCKVGPNGLECLGHGLIILFGFLIFDFTAMEKLAERDLSPLVKKARKCMLCSKK